MPSPIEFFFDFPSGYGWFASLDVEAVAARHGRAVVWRPFSLGTAFKATGAQALTRTPLKADYTELDWSRIARAKGLAFRMPKGHPHAGLPALRSFYWLDARDPLQAAAFAKAVYGGYFGGDLDIDDAPAVAEVAAGFGADRPALIEALGDPALKARVRQVGEEAVARGVFGSPWFFLDGEPFWGWDRLPMLESQLAER